MSLFKIEWLENKSPEWKVASLKPDQGELLENVSINKVSKKGEAFPNFDNLKLGETIEGELWTSNGGKYYLYAPKPQVAKNPYKNPGAMTKIIEKKNEGIRLAQDNKERGIMTSSTIRMAVDIAIAEVHNQPFDVGVFKGRIREWRKWLIAEWDEIDAPPFNPST